MKRSRALLSMQTVRRPVPPYPTLSSLPSLGSRLLSAISAIFVSITYYYYYYYSFVRSHPFSSRRRLAFTADTVSPRNRRIVTPRRPGISSST